jgi:hypothetical protein
MCATGAHSLLHDSLLSKMTGIFDTFEHFNEVYTMMNIACDDGSTNVNLLGLRMVKSKLMFRRMPSAKAGQLPCIWW